MKAIFTTLFLIAGLVSLAQRKLPPIKHKPKLDTMMIKRTGADAYGMKKYVMCFLKTGPNKSLSADSTKKIFATHLKNIQSLTNKGKLVLAGPFIDGTWLEGIFIFNVETVEEAQKLIDTHPGVQAGFFSVELRPWYGSAVLMDVPLLHTKVQAKSF